MRGRSPAAAMRASSGRATVPSATPKRPSGSCIRRKATASQKVGPSPSCEANTELTSTLTCVVLAAMTEGPIRRSTATHARVAPVKVGPVAEARRRSAGSCTQQLQRAPDQRADREPEDRRGPKCGSSQYPSSTPPTIEPRLKKLEAMAGMPNTLRGIEHAHDQRRQRHQQDERVHDARERHGQLRLRRIEPGRERRDQPRCET